MCRPESTAPRSSTGTEPGASFRLMGRCGCPTERPRAGCRTAPARGYGIPITAGRGSMRRRGGGRLSTTGAGFISPACGPGHRGRSSRGRCMRLHSSHSSGRDAASRSASASPSRRSRGSRWGGGSRFIPGGAGPVLSACRGGAAGVDRVWGIPGNSSTTTRGCRVRPSPSKSGGSAEDLRSQRGSR